MSLDRCIRDLRQSGELSDEQAAEMGEVYQDIRDGLGGDLGDDAAAALASTMTLDRLEMAAARKRFLAARTITARQKMEADLGDGAIDPARAAAFFTPRKDIGYANVDGLRQAIQRRAFAMIGDILQRHHTDAIGRLRDTAHLKDVVRAVFGEKVETPTAKGMADAWMGAAEMLRQRFNAAGGNVGKLRSGKGYLPQSHDWLKVRGAGFDTWRNTIAPLLDRAEMIDERTGLPFSDAGLDAALRASFDTIRSDGWFTRDAGSRGFSSVANRRGDARFLIFRDADSWMAYHEAFGRGSAYGAMIGHVRGMARDIAAMERFGPNPNTGVQWLRDTIEKAAHTADDKGQAARVAKSSLARMDALWNEYNGANQRPAKEWLANVGQSIRSFEVGAKMGSATLAAVPGDIATQFNSARFNKLPFTRIMANQLKLLNPASTQHRALAARMGLIFEGWTNDAAARLRVTGDALAAGAMGRMAEGVLRVSGLTVWTDSGHAAFGMGVLGHIADVRNKGFDKLDAGFRGMLERGGIGSDEWDAIRATPVRREQGSNWIFAQDIEDRDLGDRLLALIAKEENFAVQQADFETRAVMRAHVKKGTYTGEMLANSLLFKSFGISMLLSHGRRILETADWSKRASYAARLVLATTIAGAVTIQLREIAKGRDPRPMVDENGVPDPEFWLAASLQGGGWGLIADLFNAVVENRVGSWAEWIAGPVAGTIDNIARLGRNAAQHAAFEMGLAEKDGNVGRAASRIARDELPGGNLWYLRVALQRYLSDQLAEIADPRYAESFAAMQRRAIESGSDYWWSPGETEPERAPDLENALGAEVGE